MKKALQKSKKKRRGRPAIGRNIALRLSDAWLGQIEAWADERGLTRSQAIRRLIELGWGKRQSGTKGE